MRDMYIARVLRDRDGLDLPEGSILCVQYVHRKTYDNEPTLARVRRALSNVVVRYGAAAKQVELTADDVTISDVSPEELHKAWLQDASKQARPPDNAHALVAFWVPPELRNRSAAG